MSKELLRLDRLKLALEKAQNVDEAKGIRDKAEAARIYAKKVGLSRDVQNECAQLKIEAECRVGEIITAMILGGELSKGGGDQKSEAARSRKNHQGRDVSGDRKTLVGVGVGPDPARARVRSKRWQLEARLPKAERNRYYKETKEDVKGEITSEAILRLARAFTRAPDRDKLIKEKLGKLEELENEGVEVGSVWDFGARDNYAGDPDWPGNSPTQIVENAIRLLTVRGETVLDPMAGSGTTVDVCRAFDRKCLAFDIAPSRDEIQKQDARKLDLAEVADMVFWHPPYWSLIEYEKADGQLSRVGWEDFLSGMNTAAVRIAATLKKGRKMALLTGDAVRDGRFWPITRKVSNMLEDAGLEDCGIAVKLTSGSQSTVRKGKTTYAECAWTGNLRIEHDFVTIWRKQ